MGIDFSNLLIFFQIEREQRRWLSGPRSVGESVELNRIPQIPHDSGVLASVGGHVLNLVGGDLGHHDGASVHVRRSPFGPQAPSFRN